MQESGWVLKTINLMSEEIPAKKKFEMAMLESPMPLTTEEYRLLAQRYNLFSEQDVKAATSIHCEESGKIIESALLKCLHLPIKTLIKESNNRVKRYFRYEEKDGKADLELACIMLKRADLLNDCRIAFGIKCK